MKPIQFTVWAVNIGYSYWSSDGHRGGGHHRHHGAPGATPPLGTLSVHARTDERGDHGRAAPGTTAGSLVATGTPHGPVAARVTGSAALVQPDCLIRSKRSLKQLV